jgi:hypothetical protein
MKVNCFFDLRQGHDFSTFQKRAGPVSLGELVIFLQSTHVHSNRGEHRGPLITEVISASGKGWLFQSSLDEV